MLSTQSNIFTRLKKDILLLQGQLKPPGTLTSVVRGPLHTAFPNSSFPSGAVHEFLSPGIEESAASHGFIAAMINCFLQSKGVLAWVGPSKTIYPPALKLFGLNPSFILFIEVKKEKDMKWVLEEALKSGGFSAVVGEMNGIDFTTSRRFQLAVEQSQATGFLLNTNKSKPNNNACLSRWRISSLPSESTGELPGLGFPCWKVELLKMRNGKPGSWDIKWMNARLEDEVGQGNFHYLDNKVIIQTQLEKKAG